LVRRLGILLALGVIAWIDAMAVTVASAVVIGALSYLSLPWPGLWLLGTLIAIELFLQGSGWSYVGLLLRAG